MGALLVATVTPLATPVPSSPPAPPPLRSPALPSGCLLQPRPSRARRADMASALVRRGAGGLWDRRRRLEVHTSSVAMSQLVSKLKLLFGVWS